MELQQDIVDLTINNDDDCFFPTEPSETVNSLLKMDGMEGIKKLLSKTMKMTLCVYGSEDGEIATDEEKEKEEESKK